MGPESHKTIHPLHILRPFLRFWWLIVLVFLAVVLTVAFLTEMEREIFEAKGTLFIRQFGNLQGDMFESADLSRQKYLVKNQIPILKSRNLAGDVIRRLQNTSYADSLGVLGHSLSEGQKRFPFIKPSKKTSISGDSISFQEKVEKFRSATRVMESAETNVIEIRGRGPTGWEAAILVNAWIDAYLDFDIMNSKGDVGQTRDFLEKKMREVEKELNRAETQSSDFKRRNQVVSLSEETEQLVLQISKFESLHDEARTDQQANEQRLHYLKAQLDTNRMNLVENMTNLSNPNLQALQNQMTKLVGDKAAYEAQLASAGLLDANDSKLKQMEARIRGLLSQIREETKLVAQNDLRGINPLTYSENLINQILQLEIEQQSVNARVSALKDIVDEYSKKLKILPEKSLQLARLERNVKLNQEIYMQVRGKYEAVRIQEASEMANIRVIDRAEPTDFPVYPRKKLNYLLAGLLGLILGFGIVFVLQFFDHTIRSTHDLSEVELTLIGCVTKVKAKYPRFGKTADPKKYARAKSIFPFIMNYQHCDAAIEESYRAIRTHVSHTFNDKQSRVLLITSPEPGEGKSTTAVNLAIALARTGLNTLLIDCDLRQPVLDILLTSSPRKIGLTLALENDSNYTDSIIATTEDNLDLMPSGPTVHQAPELLGSESMINLIDVLKTRYEIIILDAPPVLPVTDTSVLSKLADGVILVSKLNVSSRSTMKHAADMLRKVDANILGAILIGVSKKEQYVYSDYYG